MRKTLLLKLIAILLICVLGMQSAALANPTGNTSSLAYGKEIEIEELRTTDSKTYQLSDGSFKYVGYAEEVHYKDSNGKFADIDNSITGSAEKDGYTYTNKANSWRAYFSSQLSVSKAVLLETGDYSLSFNMPSASQQNAAKKTADMTEHADSYYEDKKSDNRAVIYQEALTGVDVVYTVRTSGLKEDIVLKNAAVPHSFEFVLTADGLTAVKRDGTVYFQDREGNDIFHIGSLYMIDSNGKYSESVTCSIQQVKNGYSLVISASEEFLNAADTVYPVIIDPSIMITGTSNTFDTCVDEQYPSSNYYASENLWTGGATGTNTMRTYIKFTMPSNITAAQVTSATLRIKKREHKTPTIKAYRVTSSWSSSSVTWNNKPSYTTANGTGTITLDTGSWYKLDTTTLVKYWLAGTYSNYGFLLKEPSETSSSQKTKFYSSDAPSPNKPELIIEYNPPAATYTITYNGNGNTGGSIPESQSVASGSSVTLRTNTGGLIKAGSCTLLGWCTNSTGTGIHYSLGQTIVPSSNLTLYARWSSPTYSFNSVSMKVWVDKTYTTYYSSNWSAQASSLATEGAYPFYQTFNLSISRSSPAEMTTTKSQCPNSPNKCTIASCGSNCDNHHTNALRILQYVANNGSSNYGLNTLLFYGGTSCYGSHDSGVGGLAYPLGQQSIIQCFGSSDWGSVRRIQHEWSHNYGARHTEDGGICTSACINNGGWDNAHYKVADVWCSRCKADMEPNLENY